MNIAGEVSDSAQEHPPLDEALVFIEALVLGFTDFVGAIEDNTGGNMMSVEQIQLELPVEMDTDTLENGKLSLGIAPPTQTFETTVMPVFHRLRLTIATESITNGTE